MNRIEAMLNKRPRNWTTFDNLMLSLIMCVIGFGIGWTTHLAFGIPECREVGIKLPAEYAPRGNGGGGGFWVKDGEVVAFGYAEDDQPRTLACFPNEKF